MPAANRADRIHDRFWSKVDVRSPDECWPWSACICASSNYGRFGAGPTLGGPETWNAHRVAYELAVGPIPTGAEIDHVCHTRDPLCVTGNACPHRRCVNPRHLEVVTHRENALRRESRVPRTVFICGHPIAGNRVSNGGPSGRCGECHRAYEERRRGVRRRSA